MFDERTQTEIRQLATYWDVVEERVKRAELIKHTVVAPAIKELRYAGRWLVDAINYAMANKDHLSDADVRREFDYRLFETRLNLMQASHDAIDATVHEIGSTFRKLRNDIGPQTLIQHFPEYPQALAKLDEIGGYIALSRKERLRRNDIYEKFYETDFEFLLDLMKKMIRSEAIIQASISAEQTEKAAVLTREQRVERRESHLLRWTIAGVIAVILTGALVEPFMHAWFTSLWNTSTTAHPPPPAPSAPAPDPAPKE